jgi:hypothetical protein
MTVHLLLVLMVALAVLDGWLLHWLFINAAAPGINEWLRRREVVRHSAVHQEIQAMQAAQQLSQLAWKARHKMHDIARDTRGSQSRHATRRK